MLDILTKPLPTTISIPFKESNGMSDFTYPMTSVSKAKCYNLYLFVFNHQIISIFSYFVALVFCLLNSLGLNLSLESTILTCRFETIELLCVFFSIEWANKNSYPLNLKKDTEWQKSETTEENIHPPCHRAAWRGIFNWVTISLLPPSPMLTLLLLLLQRTTILLQIVAFDIPL